MIYASASLRISGDFDPDSVTNLLGLKPSLTFRKGGSDEIGKPYLQDVWLLESTIKDSEPLNNHILWIAEQCKGKHGALRSLKENLVIDIYCGLTSFAQSDFSLSSDALSLFSDLGIGLEVSLILFEDEE